MASKIDHIAVVGAGNVAERMINLFNGLGYEISFIARQGSKATEISANYDLARMPLSPPIPASVQLVLLCISDDAIKTVSDKLTLLSDKTIVAHTSGTKPSTILSTHCRFGCFYPLQTIRRHQDIDFTSLPILITGSDTTVDLELKTIAKSFNHNYQSITDSQKESLHLGAVMANNFTNHILAETHQYCLDIGVDFKLLQPLIAETMDKYLSDPVDPTQTGPAIRKDTKTIRTHKDLLRDQDKLRKLYTYLTNHIKQKHP